MIDGMDHKELMKRLPDHLEGTWEKDGIKIHNKVIDKSLYIFYSPRVVQVGSQMIEAYGVIINHSNPEMPNKYILKDKLEHVLEKLIELKNKL